MNNIRLRIGALVGASILSLALITGCASPTVSAQRSSGPTTISVTLRDNGIDLSSNTAVAGPVTFQVKNVSGTEVHELVVIQNGLAADKMPMQNPARVDEEKLTSMGETGDMAIGASKDLTFTLPAGHYALICNQPGHYMMGMHTDFTVTQ
jgi:uncharacterized cupredoxin-like copper-binding protein